MIRALTPEYSRSFFTDVFLGKIAEQGFGCPARRLADQRQNYAPALQKHIRGILTLTPIRDRITAQDCGLLTRINIIRKIPNQFPSVDEETAVALVNLLIVKDSILPLLAGSLEMNGFVPFREEHREWFLLLHSLEQTGVLTGVSEHLEGDMVGIGYYHSSGGRDFIPGDEKLREFVGDAAKHSHALATAQRAQDVDEDASSLLKILNSVRTP